MTFAIWLSSYTSAAVAITPTFSVGHLYQRNCIVGLLIRIPPLSYALVGGSISLLMLWLVQFRPVNWNTGMA